MPHESHTQFKRRPSLMHSLVNIVEIRIAFCSTFYAAVYDESNSRVCVCERVCPNETIHKKKTRKKNHGERKYACDSPNIGMHFYTEFGFMRELTALAVAKHNKHSIAWHQINEPPANRNVNSLLERCESNEQKKRNAAERKHTTHVCLQIELVSGSLNRKMATKRCIVSKID